MKKITAVFSAMAGLALGTGVTYKLENDKLKEMYRVNDKNDAILKIFTRWLKLKQDGKQVADCLKERGYKTIAIYGMHYLGECLLKELKNSEIEVKYAIDRNANNIYADVDVITLDDNLLEVDAIVVTAFWFFDEIESELMEIVDYPVVSLVEIIDEMEYDTMD